MLDQRERKREPKEVGKATLHTVNLSTANDSFVACLLLGGRRRLQEVLVQRERERELKELDKASLYMVKLFTVNDSFLACLFLGGRRRLQRCWSSERGSAS